MKIPQKPFVLYFIDGPTATKKDMLKAQQYAFANLQYRNARLVTGEEKGVKGVAGAIPPCYKGYPTADEALEDYGRAIQAAREASGDDEAPTPLTEPSERKLFDEEDGDEAETKPVPTPKPKATPTPKKKK